MAQYLLFAPIFIALAVIGWGLHQRQRDFDRLYEMFGTTFSWEEDLKREPLPKFPPFK